jgi:hypothetical protein
MSNGLFEQIDKSFIHTYEKKAMADLAYDMETMMMFGEKFKLAKEATRLMADMMALGKLTMKDVLRVKKLIDSDDAENINLALHLLNSKA